MFDKRKKVKKHPYAISCWWWAGVGMGAMALILQIAARRKPGFGEWYARNIYPLLSRIFGLIFGWFPFSVVEFGLYLLLLFCIFSVVRFIKNPKRIVPKVWAFVTGLFLVYTLNCGINYYRIPFSGHLGLEISKYSKAELYQLCQYLTDQVNFYWSEVKEEDEKYGGADLVKRKNLSQMNRQGREALINLAARYPQLSGFYPKPKPVAVSWILSVQQLSGIFSPFTMEANYNQQMPLYNIPHTMCHELSHLRGFMREDEANFIGYLACIQSEDQYFRYSGYLTGWIYAGNALAGEDPDSYLKIYQQLNEGIIEDLKENNVFWDRYEGKIAEAATRANDTYLKINDQSEGVKTYGRMTDLMLAYYLWEQNSERDD